MMPITIFDVDHAKSAIIVKQADLTDLTRAIAIAIATERERCAQVAEWEGYATVGRQIAAAIRALKDIKE